MVGITSQLIVAITCSGAAVAATYTSPNLSAKIACSPSLVKVAALTFLGHFLQVAARQISHFWHNALLCKDLEGFVAFPTANADAVQSDVA